MSGAKKLGKAKFALLRQKYRLTREIPFKASLVIAPFLAATVLTIYTSLETATRLYSVAHPLEHITASVNDQDVWLSIAPRGNDLVITTINGQMFSWPLTGPTPKERAALDNYLRERAEQLVRDATLRGQIKEGENTVALSVDQALTFHHVRPLLYALADAGFSKYGFETRIVR